MQMGATWPRMSIRGNPARKIADRYAGIPLLRLIGALPKRQPPDVVRRIGVLRTAAIGDTLLLSGVLRDLRNGFPSADLVLVTGTDNAEAGALISAGVARHLTISVRDPFGSLAKLRQEHFDILLDTGAWPRLDALLAALSGARFRVGFRTPGQYRHYAYDRVTEHSAAVHESENFRALARAVGVESATKPSLSRAALAVPAQLPRKPFVVFHPWSGGYRGALKEWPAKRWVELARRLRSLEAAIIVTGSTANASGSERLARAIKALGMSAESMAGRLSLAQLGALLCQSLIVVSVNTGVMHLSALLDVPTVALEGPSPSHRWGPIGARAVAVTSTLPGCGFLNLGFEYDGQRTDCMLGIAVDDVERAVRRLIAGA